MKERGRAARCIMSIVPWGGLKGDWRSRVRDCSSPMANVLTPRDRDLLTRYSDPRSTATALRILTPHTPRVEVTALTLVLRARILAWSRDAALTPLVTPFVFPLERLPTHFAVPRVRSVLLSIPFPFWRAS